MKLAGQQTRASRRRVTWIALGALASGAGPGCDDGPGAVGPDGERSGTRLELEWHDFGGTRYWTSFHDLQRDESCLPRDWSDGRSYCAPSKGVALARYADASCTRPIAVVARSTTGCAATPPAYLLESEQQACTSRAHRLYRLGAKETVSEYYLGGTMCRGPFTVGTEDVYGPGAEVSTAELAELTLAEPDIAARLSVRFYEGSDGSRFPSQSLHDAELGAECWFGFSTEGTDAAQCEPTRYTGVNAFLDAACTQPAVRPVVGGCEQPFYRLDTDRCPSTPYRWFELGAPIDASQVYSHSGGTCQSSTTQGAMYWSITEVKLVNAPRAPDNGAARIRTIHLELPGGATFRDGSLYDTERDTECLPLSLPSGAVRCVPSRGPVLTLYTDPACATQLKLFSLSSNGAPPTCPAVLPAYALESPEANESCDDSNYAVYRIEEEHIGPLYQRGTTCQPYPTSMSTRLFRVGAPIPVDAFALATSGRGGP